ncbi:MAG: hypothetical protein ACRDD8_14220 [Bacteroidales bacterium]
MQTSIEHIIKRLSSNHQELTYRTKEAIGYVNNKYSDKITEKTNKLSELKNKKKMASNLSIRQLYALDKSIDILNSDIDRLLIDMSTELNNLVYKVSKSDINTMSSSALSRAEDIKSINIEGIVNYLQDNGVDLNTQTNQQQNTTPNLNNVSNTVKPWDYRMYRAVALTSDNTELTEIIPYNIEQSNVSTYGYYPSNKQIQANKASGRYSSEAIEGIIESKRKAQNDILNTGVYAINNPYALVTLYGSKGGELLMDKKSRRSWYEVDNVSNMEFGYAKNPTTSTIISWGNADPYGRTPYQFSDFVLCKYWQVVPNNRLITLRRYPAPVVDNLNFPGMTGTSDSTSPSSSQVQFSPVSTAVTFFGDETSNKLSSILKFSAGLNWEDVTANVWKPQAADPGKDGIKTSLGIEDILGKLNIFGGNWDMDAAMRHGNGVPDPYEDGPYSNRIVGPVNAITSVKKRKQGIDFKMDGLNIVFEYKSRPLGGVNTKAIFLDLLSNFTVMGTSNAIFFGGAHRFLSSPKGYPFLGGDSGMQSFYRGEPVKFAGSLIEEATSNGLNIFAGISDMMSKIWDAVKTFDASKLFALGEGKSGGFLGNATQAYMASRANIAVPHLQGMRALLIGEAVGEWHLTVGNPLNPIALIGNLICSGIEVEFGDELGPDDFPLDLKVTVKLQHGMARDKDAIQSIFNRGYGRIYALPDNFKTSADKNTHVDNNTKQSDSSDYYTSDDIMSGVIIASKGQMLGAKTTLSIKDNVMRGAPSVWNRLSFDSTDINSASGFKTATINNRTIYRNHEWISEAGLT